MVSSEQRERYRVLRAEFHAKRDALREQIAVHESEIRGHRIDISQLEREINEVRPKVRAPEAIGGICKPCDIYSMVYTHTVPGQGSRERWYECVICGYKNYYN